MCWRIRAVGNFWNICFWGNLLLSVENFSVWHFLAINEIYFLIENHRPPDIGRKQKIARNRSLIKNKNLHRWHPRKTKELTCERNLPSDWKCQRMFERNGRRRSAVRNGNQQQFDNQLRTESHENQTPSTNILNYLNVNLTTWHWTYQQMEKMIDYEKLEPTSFDG